MTHYLTAHTTFATFEELDTAVCMHRDFHCSNLNKTDCAVLNLIRNESKLHLAAHLPHETFESALNLSNSTVRRTIRKLESLRIISRIYYVRPVMKGLGPNIYVIVPIETSL